MKAKHMKRAAQVLMLIVVAALFVYPFWWMLVNSLNTAAQVFGKPTLLPVAWRFVNYVEIFQVQPFARHLMNSVLVALIGTVGNILVSALSGYGFARIRFPGNNILFILLLTALMMPIEVIIVPLFFQMLQWGFSDSLVPLMLIPIFGAQGAFSAFMFRQFFVTVPLELEEAAKLDGLHAGHLLAYHAAHRQAGDRLRRDSRVPRCVEYLPRAARLHQQHREFHASAVPQ